MKENCKFHLKYHSYGGDFNLYYASPACDCPFPINSPFVDLLDRYNIDIHESIEYCLLRTDEIKLKFRDCGSYYDVFLTLL